MSRRIIEIWVGFFVALGIVAIFILAMQVSNLNLFKSGDGYRVNARFENISGLKSRAPVTVAGVKVGEVADIRYDSDTFEAIVTLNIEKQFNQLPLDTGANIYTAGLLGEKYIGLEPGGEEEVLVEGSELMLTQSSIVLEKLISQFLFSQGDKGAGE